MQAELGKAAFQAGQQPQPLGMELRAPGAQGSGSRCSPVPAGRAEGPGLRHHRSLPQPRPALPARALIG